VYEGVGRLTQDIEQVRPDASSSDTYKCAASTSGQIGGAARGERVSER